MESQATTSQHYVLLMLFSYWVGSEKKIRLPNCDKGQSFTNLVGEDVIDLGSFFYRWYKQLTYRHRHGA